MGKKEEQFQKAFFFWWEGGGVGRKEIEGSRACDPSLEVPGLGVQTVS